ncbi:MAG TPA: hypothetical protein VF331_26765 [Polyangiales bacterium]
MSSSLLRQSALLLALMCTAGVASAQEHDRALTSGLALGLGVGNENALFGGHALYYLQLPNECWRIAPHVGVGWIGATGVTAGVMGSLGRRHRLVMDLLAGPLASTGGTDIKTRLYYGVAALVGYEYMAKFGLALRTTIGLAYRPTLAVSERVYVAFNLLSVDYKLW